MKEKVSLSVSALIVILYWTVTRCHVGQSRRRVSSDSLRHASASLLVSFLPPKRGGSRFASPSLSLSLALLTSYSLSRLRTSEDIPEKEIPNERAIESRLYNSWNHPAFVVDGSPPLRSFAGLLAIVTPQHLNADRPAD